MSSPFCLHLSRRSPTWSSAAGVALADWRLAVDDDGWQANGNTTSATVSGLVGQGWLVAEFIMMHA